ncbi:hypothetical protein Vafri_3410 [Volvox africanus]|uniref:Cysteine-rich transmembrane CYSTM domain-containing protein n=1 Tax=Volvox africanus TaxID=51714 RepID=A0A8J4ARS7_9CHLO|nr:hypothetical protein Vafri_3410 [Volvox africanus]
MSWFWAPFSPGLCGFVLLESCKRILEMFCPASESQATPDSTKAVNETPAGKESHSCWGKIWTPILAVGCCCGGATAVVRGCCNGALAAQSCCCGACCCDAPVIPQDVEMNAAGLHP